MLDFTDAAYQFFPAKPSRFVMWVTRSLNHLFILKGPNHRVADIEIEGEMDRVKELHQTGARLLFIANHPSHSDPQFMIEIQRRLGIKSFFMAAYDVFLRSRCQAWLMQKMGCFSIDREGSDRKAMSAAIETLKQGEYSLTIFPEGNVYLMNDRVTPFLDGTSFIAVKAQQALKGEGEVWVVPISFKFSQLDDISDMVWERVKMLAEDSDFNGSLGSDHPEETVVNLGGHLLSQFFEDEADLDRDFDFSGITGDELKGRLLALVTGLVGDLEDALELDRNDETFIVDRVRKVRSKIHQIKISDTATDGLSDEDVLRLADRAILCFRILAYVLPYLKEHDSIDRYAETVERLCEDFYFRTFRPLGRRKAMAAIGKPISLNEVIEGAGGKARNAVPDLTKQMETAVQQGVDKLNSENKAFGATRL